MSSAACIAAALRSKLTANRLRSVSFIAASTSVSASELSLRSTAASRRAASAAAASPGTASSSRAVLAAVGSADVRERVLQDSWHVATLDVDAPVVTAETLALVQRVAGVAGVAGMAGAAG